MTCDLFDTVVSVRPMAVRGYWFTDCGQRVGQYLEAGRYRVADGCRKIEGIEAVRLVRTDGPFATFWVPTAVVAGLSA